MIGMFVIVSFAVLLRTVAASTSCSICATGETIGLPHKNITITGYPTLTCSQIQAFADTGAVPQSQCGNLSQLSTPCGCMGGSAPITVTTTIAPQAPTKKPVAPTKKPMASTKKPSQKPLALPTSSCSICPVGENILNPNALVTISSLGSLTCAQFEARASALSATGICSRLPSLASQCGCSGSGTPTAPAPTLALTSPTVSTPHSTTSSGCSICQVGKSMQNPNATVTIPNLGSLTCSEFESRAAALSLTGICDKLATLASRCGCTGGGAPTFAPVASAAASSTPSEKPATSPTVHFTTNSSCSICPSGLVIENPNALVYIPNVGSLTCSEFEARAVELGTTAVCSKLPLLAASCGCASGGIANSCSICPAGKEIMRPNAVVTISNLGSLTCAEINARAPALAATGICTSLHQLVGQCGCSGGGAPSPSFAPIASAAASYMPSQNPSSICSVCPAGQVIRHPGAIITFPDVGSMNCSEIEARAPTLAATGICSKLSLLSSQCGCEPLNGSAPFMAPVASPSQKPVTITACSICPDGEVIGNPKQSITSGSGIFTCSQLQAYADQRIISAAQCSQMNSFAGKCGCTKNNYVPSSAPAWQPSAPTSSGSCSICPSGQTVKRPNMQVEIFGIGKFNCSQIQESAEAGNVPADQCPALTTFAPECGCVAVSNTPNLKPASAPTQSTNNGSCSICAAGQTMGYPSRSITVPGYPSFTCKQVQGFADLGTKSTSYCRQLPQFATKCGCSGGTAPTPVSTKSSCSICAEGQTIGSPDIAVTSGGSTYSCQQLQSLAAKGIIPTEQCAQLPQLATTCGCIGGTASVIPTIAPIAPSTTPVATPTAPSCSICSAGQTLGNADTIVDTGSTGKMSCKTIAGYASHGVIPSDQCSKLPLLASTCGCTGGASPTTSPAKPTAAAPTCSICGAGKVVANGAVSVTSAQGTYTCAEIEHYANQKVIPPSQCPSLPKLASTCGCKDAASTPATAPISSEAPSVASTYPPTQYVTYLNRGTSAGKSITLSSWIVAAAILLASFSNLIAS